MVSAQQKREIKKRMRRIKDAKDNGESKEKIEEHTKELYRYMRSEGLIPLNL